MRVLLVEDEAVTRRAFAEALARAGHSVTKAKDGGEALGLLRHDGTFDTIVCDVVMERMSGMEMLFEAQKENLISCPVVVVTGYPPSMCGGVEGITAVLTKPVGADVLVACVEMLAKQREDKS